ncbi:MAG: glycoside hydrolase family 3 C-terminal domain-containing protein [Bacteroidales bacterium]|nr:glycoside hydrolase family 3 C-terminal domain-containing protein [Bacteroidales bacterium]
MRQTLHTLSRIAVIALILNIFGTIRAQSYPWQDTTLSLDSRAEWLVRNLTLDEKLSLMVHQNPAIPRVGLPAYSWWNEALHGVGRAGLATVYPMPIALAATFNPDLVQNIFEFVAAEARYKYHLAQDTGYFGDYSGLTFFTPNINIFRDPRWGRGMETYGEDPYLTATMGMACVNGIQNWDSEFWAAGNAISAAACLKHFAVHSGPEGIRHEFDSRVSERDLRSTYLPAFEYIIKNSDVQQVMCGYNRLNGEPCCTNRRLFDILRNEWQYDGILVTDCWALNDAYETDTVIPRHRTHATAALAYGDAFGREVDLECGSGLPALREAVQQGLVSESKVDEHVRRILRTRLRVTDEPRLVNDSVDSDPDVLQPYTQSMVLLKNNGVLPLKKGESLRLEGPNVWDSLMPLGNYNGTPRHTVTIGEALGKYQVLSAGDGKTLVYAGGLNPQLEGEELPVEKEGFYKGDRTLIELPKEQVEEIKAFKAQGYRIVLVLCTGSAIALENVIDDCDAVLVGWYGGELMGTAVHELLFGRRDDFGRLPVTFYRSTDDLPSFDDYAMQQRTYRYADRERVEFPFGYGLSYSFHQLWGAPVVDEANFTVSGLVSQCNTDAPNARNHRTVVQVYLKNENDNNAPVKQLIAVLPVTTVDFDHKVPFKIELDPFWFRQYNTATGQMEEPKDGTLFTLQVGFSSDDRDLVDLPYTYHNRK